MGGSHVEPLFDGFGFGTRFLTPVLLYLERFWCQLGSPWGSSLLLFALFEHLFAEPIFGRKTKRDNAGKVTEKRNAQGQWG